MKNLLQQLTRLWGQLGINQRVTLGLASLGVLAGMIALVAWSGRPQMQLLYGRLGEKDVNEVLTVLQEQGVKYELGGGGGSVYVPAESVHKMRIALASKGVPAGEGVGFEVFDRANFGISDFVQRTNFVRALQGELSRTIAQLQGVQSARVLIVVPENRLLFSEVKAKPTASVFIEGHLAADAVNSIRFLVANAVEGLHADDVAVVDNRGNVLTDGLKDDPQLGSASSQMKLRKSVEDYFAGKVETMLGKVLGPGSAVVRVSAEIDAESTSRVEERYDPEGQVVRSDVSTEDSTITHETDAGAATAGVSANIPASGNTPSDPAKAGGKNTEQVRKNKTQSFEINRVTLNAVRAPGSVARVTAAVFVAAKATPRTPVELEALRRMVVNALGIKAADDKELAKIVTLEEVAFEATPAVKPGALDVAMNNMDTIKYGLALAAAAVLFFIFLRMLKSTKPDEIPMELIELRRGQNGEAGAINGPITVELLNDMIRQKPGNVGAALRDWMTNGETRN